MSDRYLSVSQLNAYIKAKFDTDSGLARVLIQAEISNFTRHSSGHLYLSLKDKESQVKAVMFASQAKGLLFSPKDGDKVLIEGRVSVYEPSGSYQVYIQKMTLDGIGDLYLKYEQLKAKLQEAGWFDPIRKQPIPKFPKAVGVITSPTGAAIRDIIHIIERRYPLTRLYLYPALVQGPEAKFSIKAQIEKANVDRFVDVLIVGRGGGSIEDLWAFNEEIVLKAIKDSTIPIIAAVGHETDFTLTDFVSDLRAPTPSGAAEVAVPDKHELLALIKRQKQLLTLSMQKLTQTQQKRLQGIKNHRYFTNPFTLLEKKILTLDFLKERLDQSSPKKLLAYQTEKQARLRKDLSQAYQQSLTSLMHSFQRQVLHLDALSPLKVLSQGYSVVYQKQQVVSSIQHLDQTQVATVQMRDGSFEATIQSIRKDATYETKS